MCTKFFSTKQANKKTPFKISTNEDLDNLIQHPEQADYSWFKPVIKPMVIFF